MRLFLFAFGKLKTPGLRDAADYYQRMLRPWVPLEEIELKPQPVPEKMSDTRVRIQKKEEEILLERLESKTSSSRSPWLYLLDESGKPRSSLDWAKHLQELESDGVSHLVFSIGSSLGFSDNLKRKAKGLFSLGPQTLSHELARVVLLEQLYRSYSIIKRHPYHNQD